MAVVLDAINDSPTLSRQLRGGAQGGPVDTKLNLGPKSALSPPELNTKRAVSAPPEIRGGNAGVGEVSGGKDETADFRAASSDAEEALEESAVKEVLEEWKPREGRDADEHRFRKFKHGERVDVVRNHATLTESPKRKNRPCSGCATLRTA